MFNATFARFKQAEASKTPSGSSSSGGNSSSGGSNNNNGASPLAKTASSPAAGTPEAYPKLMSMFGMRSASSTPDQSPPKREGQSPRPPNMSTEEMARLESMARPDLIATVAKQKQLTTRYQRKLNDLVAAYKDASLGNKKLEAALEKQQDKAAARTRELIEGHKKDLATKERLSDAIRRRNESLQGELATLQERYTEAAAQLKEHRGAESAHSATSEVADRLRAKMALVKEELASRDARVVQLVSRVEALSADLKASKLNAEQLAVSMKQKGKDLALAAETSAALRQALVAKEGTVSSSADMLVGLQQRNANSDAALAASKAELASLQAQLDAFQQSNAEAAAAAASEVRRKAAANTDKLDSLRNEIAEHDRGRAELSAKVQAMAAKLLAAQERTSEMAADAESAKSLHSGEIAKLQGRIEVLQSRGQQQQQQQQAAAGVGAGVMNQSSEALMESQIADLHKQIEKRGNESAQQLESVRADLRKRSEECNAATVRLQLTEASAAEADSAKSRVQEKLRSANQELEAVTSTKAALNLKCSQLENELTAAKSTVQLGEQQRGALDNLINTLRQTVKDKEAHAGSHRLQVQEAEVKLSAKTEELVSASAELAALKVKHGASTAMLETAREEHAAALAASAKRLAAATERAEAAGVEARDRAKALARATERAEDLEAETDLAGKRAAAELKRVKAALTRAESELETNADALVKTSKSSKATAAAVEEAAEKAATLQAELQRMVAKEAAARAEVDRLAEELSSTTARLRREEANAASHKYTTDAQAAQLKSLRSERDQLSEQGAATRAASGDTVRDLSMQVAKAEAELVQAERLASVEQQAAEQSSLQLMQAEAKLELLEPELASAKEARDALQSRCNDLESQAAMSASAMDGLQAAHTDATQRADTASSQLAEAELKCADSTARLAAAEAEALEYKSGKEKAEIDHQAAVVEHLLASKKQQQHAAELKKTLQKSLKQAGGGGGGGGSSGGAFPATSAASGHSSTSLSPSSPYPYPNVSAIPSLASLAAPGGFGSPAAPPLNVGEETQYPDHLEVNFMYLKNVIIKYMTTGTADARQLLKVISTVLRFTRAEENKVKAYLDGANSWLPTSLWG